MMFVAAECVPYKKRVAEKWRRKKSIERVRVPVSGGASFFRLLVPTCGEIPWKAVQKAVGTVPVLFAHGMQTPPDGTLRSFTPQRLPLLCAARTATELLRHRAPVPSLGVLDPLGCLCGKTAFLFSAARDVRIVTDKAEKFAGDVQFAMREWGAALTVGRERTLLNGCTVIVCENGNAAPSAEAVFCVRQSVQRADGVYLSRLGLPSDIKTLCPSGMEPLLFAAALYELCGTHAPERCRFADFHAGAKAARFIS